LAAKLVEHLAPKRALDIGCAKGFLLEVLHDRGVEAHGVDSSADALDEIRSDLRRFARVLDAATLDTDVRYDVVTCIEVLEHMEEAPGLALLDAMCRLAPRVVFSSSRNRRQREHANVQAVGYWVEAFADRGFSPRLDLSLSDSVTQTLVFSRCDETTPPDVRALYAETLEQRVALEAQAEALRAALRSQHVAEQELAHFRGTDGWRIAQFLRRQKEQLLPEDSGRFRAWSQARQAALTLLGADAAAAGPPPRSAPSRQGQPPVAQPAPLEERDRQHFARQHLRGRGLEIGALHFPLPVPDGVVVRYVDKMTRQELIAKFPTLDATCVVEPTVIDDGFTLATVADASQDFVIANHVLEHGPNPLGALLAWIRVLRTGGTLFVTIPIAERCFDRGRDVTPVDHFFEDLRLHRANDGEVLRQRDLAHYVEWLTISKVATARERGEDPPRLDAKQIAEKAEHMLAEKDEIHFHTFSPNTFRLLLRRFCAEFAPTLKVVGFGESGIEVIAVLVKGAVK
jgi:2-polyprenyl-3-methyl-5-hydroxy-6-metoxy-1,4-benzoquinol methylase